MDVKMKEQVDKAVEVVKRGGVILYPTDTIWGIGCDATNPNAVERVYEIKRSENKKSMLVLVASINDAARYTGLVPSVAWDLMEVADKPLTLVLPGATGVAENLVPEEGTIGIRIPDDDFCQSLLRRLGRPLVSTSANITDRPTPLYYEDIEQEILDAVDLVVDPKCETRSATHQPSSLIAIGTSGEINIIRE